MASFNSARDIFISYDNDNENIRKNIVDFSRTLNQMDFSTYYNMKNIRNLLDPLEEILNSINNCRLFISFISKGYFDSECTNEFYWALRQKKDCIFVFIDDKDYSNNQIYQELKKYQHIHLYKDATLFDPKWR
jgi:hypothetical protein